MPWSPLKYTDIIFKELKRKGYTFEVPKQVMHAEIMRQTILVRMPTISNVTNAFKTLGYIKESPSGGFWIITYWDDKIPKIIKKPEHSKVDKYNELIG